MNIPIVIKALRKLSNWLDDANKETITKIIEELENTNISEFRLRQLKYQLSTEMLFHPKYLGDLYIPNFRGGNNISWHKYLIKVADLCQKNL